METRPVARSRLERNVSPALYDPALLRRLQPRSVPSCLTCVAVAGQEQSFVYTLESARHLVPHVESTNASTDGGTPRSRHHHWMRGGPEPEYRAPGRRAGGHGPCGDEC